MDQINLEFLEYVYWAALALVYLAGLGTAVFLLVKKKGTPAILAAVAFALLFLTGLGQIARKWFLDGLIRQYVLGHRFGPWRINNCCCGILEIAAFVCLIVAVRQALLASAAEET